jgi:mono/diheme cytochrome c family protein
MAKIVSVISGLGSAAALCVVVLCVLVLGLGAAPAAAQDELRRELVPGLDLWLRKHEAAPYWQALELSPELSSRAARHREFMAAGVPLEYRSRRSPYPAATQVIQDGGRLYRLHCAACHGADGLGNGDAGRDLTPSPALLAYMIGRRRSVDEYLLWSISEGGAPFGTEMPAYKDSLAERQIWQIVAYMRAGFPLAGDAGQD